MAQFKISRIHNHNHSLLILLSRTSGQFAGLLPEYNTILADGKTITLIAIPKGAFNVMGGPIRNDMPNLYFTDEYYVDAIVEKTSAAITLKVTGNKTRQGICLRQHLRLLRCAVGRME